MNVEELREHCLSLTGSAENMPWIDTKYSMLVTFTVAGKWFCLLDLDRKHILVKCAPETVEEMQARYRGAVPAWHMNKKHWLGIDLDSDVPDDVISRLLSEGHKLVVKLLPRAVRAALDRANENF